MWGLKRQGIQRLAKPCGVMSLWVQALQDFRDRICKYEEVYETITDRNLHYIKLIDMWGPLLISPAHFRCRCI